MFELELIAESEPSFLNSFLQLNFKFIFMWFN